MVSYGVASATDSNGTECVGVSTGCEFGGASAGCESGGASAGSESGGASAVVDVVAAVADSAVAAVVAAVDVVVPATYFTTNIPLPFVGLTQGESVLHGGALEVPVFLDGSESPVLALNQTVLWGGFLKKPHIFTDLIAKDGLQFITLDKTSDGLCLYLTGMKAKAYPLKHVVLFDDMQKTMIRHCDAIMAESKVKIAAAQAKIASAAMQAMDKIVKKTVARKGGLRPGLT